MSPVLADRKDDIAKLFAKYPSKRSGMLPLLWMVQQREGWISQESMEEVADLLECTVAEVYEVVSFYTMFQQKPVGRYHLALCDTLSCAICGAFEIVEYLRQKHGIEAGKVTDDGRFSLELVECIGACANAPAMLVNETLEGDLTPEKLDKILEKCT
jgi:NADH-quinone oxidoreductase subunit E